MRRRRATTVLAATIALLSLAIEVPASATPHGPVGVRTIASGVTYERIEDRDGPWVLHVARVDPSRAATIDLAAGGAAMGHFSRPSDIGKAHGALVAINGDFGGRSGRPIHPFMVDGSLMANGARTGVSFAVAHDESRAFVGPGRFRIRGTHIKAGRRFAVAGWNSGRPALGEIGAFTRYGGSVAPPPDDSCFARLEPEGPVRWGSGGAVARRYVVHARRCRPAPPTAVGRTVVLASRRKGGGATTIKGMRPGDAVRLSWSIGWPNVLDSIGGMPQIVDDGENVAGTCASYFCRRNPRTAVGVTADGTVLLLVVDGRSSRSVGMTLIELGRALLSLGAVEAMNLDGGGSSAMWIAGRGIVNNPSDSSGERLAVNAVLALPAEDPGEPPMRSLLSPARPADAALAAMLAATDPGSTGGLADALLGGHLDAGSRGAGRRLPPALSQAARLFSARS